MWINLSWFLVLNHATNNHEIVLGHLLGFKFKNDVGGRQTLQIPFIQML